MILSILTCTLPERAHYLKRLGDNINKQIEGKPVEWLIDIRNKFVPTGTKRNDLIRQSKGAWVCFVDDDDNIMPDYIDCILTALESNPDVVTFEGWMTTNGKFTANWVIKLGERYEERGGVYYRFPNHLCPIRKSIAVNIQFPNVWQMEDYRWAEKVRISGQLKTSVHINKPLYHYDFKQIK
jgi:hypothetical protein